MFHSVSLLSQVLLALGSSALPSVLLTTFMGQEYSSICCAHNPPHFPWLLVGGKGEERPVCTASVYVYVRLFPPS